MNTPELNRFVELFRQTWAERDELRIVRTAEQATGSTVNRRAIHEAAQTRSQELFQPALQALESGIPVLAVIEQLLERLSKA